ncbi:MAG TPA: creatininase family protein [Sedimentisphaerales bacterium]|nr:creatininase family protein [Sedimentisphaerales bacterium]
MMNRREFIEAGSLGLILANNLFAANEPQGIETNKELCLGNKGTQSYKYEEMTAGEFKRAMDEVGLVYVPVGSLEFHGQHLPLGTDTIHAYEFCLRAAEMTAGVVVPCICWGTNGHVGWTGSLLVRESTFRMILRDVFELLCEQGARLIVASTGHWPAKQGVIIEKIAKQVMKKYAQTRILVLDPFGCNPTDKEVDHAGKKETSLMLALRPELVYMEKLGEGDEAFKGICKNAVEGNVEYGKEYFQVSLEVYVDMVKKALSDLGA